ncbi:MAG: hypothetical protein H7A25_15835 [Leptospiraceae bacterium]|nr:hypothetical protein [Leptospiraceae bacterium]
MRADEELVKNIIVEKYLSNFKSYRIIDGNRNHPPDYKVFIGSHEYLLEITQCTAIAIEEDNQTITSTKSINYPILNIENELNNYFKGISTDDMVFKLRIKGPILNFNSFKKDLKLYLKNIIDNKEYSNYNIFRKFNVSNELIEIKIKEKINKNDKSFTIISMIKSKNHEYNIESHIKKALTHIIKTKYEKLKNLNGTKWLGILNDYFLASLDTYNRVLKSNIDKYDFGIIFIVDKNKNLLPFMCNK